MKFKDLKNRLLFLTLSFGALLFPSSWVMAADPKSFQQAIEGAPALMQISFFGAGTAWILQAVIYLMLLSIWGILSWHEDAKP